MEKHCNTKYETSKFPAYDDEVISVKDFLEECVSKFQTIPNNFCYLTKGTRDQLPLLPDIEDELSSLFDPQHLVCTEGPLTKLNLFDGHLIAKASQLETLRLLSDPIMQKPSIQSAWQNQCRRVMMEDPQVVATDISGVADADPHSTTDVRLPESTSQRIPAGHGALNRQSVECTGSSEELDCITKESSSQDPDSGIGQRTTFLASSSIMRPNTEPLVETAFTSTRSGTSNSNKGFRSDVSPKRTVAGPAAASNSSISSNIHKQKARRPGVVLGVAIYRNTQPVSLRKKYYYRLEQEFAVLGEQSLCVLRDAITCLSDHTVEGPVYHERRRRQSKTTDRRTTTCTGQGPSSATGHVQAYPIGSGPADPKRQGPVNPTGPRPADPTGRGPANPIGNGKEDPTGRGPADPVRLDRTDSGVANPAGQGSADHIDADQDNQRLYGAMGGSREQVSVPVGPRQPLRPRSGRVYTSGFFYIDGVFYNDTRYAANLDYSAVVREWMSRSGRRMEYRVEAMESTTFLDLRVRLGFPYMYAHQGDCEHVLVFTEMRMLAADDCTDVGGYPRPTRVNMGSGTICGVCDRNPSAYITYDDELSPCVPNTFCARCYELLHFEGGDADGPPVAKASRYAFVDYHVPRGLDA